MVELLNLYARFVSRQGDGTKKHFFAGTSLSDLNSTSLPMEVFYGDMLEYKAVPEENQGVFEVAEEKHYKAEHVLLWEKKPFRKAYCRFALFLFLRSYLEENKYKIEAGQAFTIEPGIYFPGKLGIRIEDTVVFDGKVKVLTKSRKDLICVKI